MTKVHVKRRLPTFISASVSGGKTGSRVKSGYYKLISSETDADGNVWFRLRGIGWIVAESEGHVYAEKVEENKAAAVVPDWRDVLKTEQDSQPWVKGAQEGARACIDTRASALQRLTCEKMIGIIGIKEIGSNRGPALSGIVGEYIQHYRIGNPLKTGLMWCALAAQWAQAEAAGIDWMEPAGWSDHVLGNWYGAAWMQEKHAKRKGVWVDCNDLKGTENLAGAMLVQIRGGSGSDSGSGGIGKNGDYKGHTDIILGWVIDEPFNVWVVGGNLGNTCKTAKRDLRAARNRGVVHV